MTKSIIIHFTSFSILSIFLVGCFNTTEDLSKKKPYNEAIGKRFIVKKNMFIYQHSDSNVSQIGTPEYLKSMVPIIPSVVNVKYVGTQAGSVKITGIVKKNQVVTLNRIIIDKSFESSFFSFRVFVDGNSYFSKHECDCSSIINRSFNPPKTSNWSDPPIFKADLIEPLPSDGIWWK